MATRRRRRFTADLKKRVVLEALRGTERCRRSLPRTRSIPTAWGSDRTLRSLRNHTERITYGDRLIFGTHSVHNLDLDSIALCEIAWAGCRQLATGHDTDWEPGLSRETTLALTARVRGPSSRTTGAPSGATWFSRWQLAQLFSRISPTCSLYVGGLCRASGRAAQGDYDAGGQCDVFV